ncbi:hypothetical protein ILUMI_22718 [Ignelater luminosus]|uniref:Metaxin n=1 Tax=Ignelater luminosus TaxID=2038154 RepID=A0A8K0CDW3_IGNLU|nr:hypothetical protein ILUMI_22718 [Ignelater luminosus]
MNVRPPVVVRVWEGDFGVPSVDPFCLYLMTMLKVRKVNVTFENACMPSWRSIPSIQFEKKILTQEFDLVQAAMKIRDNPTVLTIDNHLDANNRSRLMAYIKYFVESFEINFYFECWLNDANFEHAIKPWYNAVIPFPFNYFYLKRNRELARKRHMSIVGQGDPEQYKMEQNLILARCLEDFSNMLRDGRLYFFGDVPTTLDITIYSYLAIAMNMPLPDSQLQAIVKSHYLLARFVRNMTDIYFTNTPTTLKYVQPVSTSANNSDRAPTKTLILAGVFATTAMLLYSWNIGLLRPKWPRS